jgi:subtilisin family serine protease
MSPSSSFTFASLRNRCNLNPGRILMFVGVAGLLTGSTGASAVPPAATTSSSDSARYSPRELIIKLRPTAATNLRSALATERAVSPPPLTASLDELNTQFGVSHITSVFQTGPAMHERVAILKRRDTSTLNDAERNLLRRAQRAPQDVLPPQLDNIFLLTLSPEQPVEAAMDAYSRDPDVVYAEPNMVGTLDALPDDPYYNVQWSLQNDGQPYLIPGGGTNSGVAGSDVHAPEAWSVYAPITDVVVAIVDSGVDYNHPDLASRMWTDGNGHYGYDFRTPDNDPMDDLGHGTHCAGIVAATFDNSIGISGLCPNARIMALKWLNRLGNGSISQASASIQYAVDHGTDVISNSWGFDYLTYTMQAALDYALSAGVVVVASAGNAGGNYHRYPAMYPGVISVAATDATDTAASFTSVGEWVDLAAPGVDILSLRAAGTDMYPDPYRIVDTDYYIASGTSMSCPHVAAAAAMLIGQDPTLTVEAIKNRLIGTTDAIVDTNPAQSEWLGTGRLNAYRALTEAAHPVIRVSDFHIRDNLTGNGNGRIDPGEIALLEVTLGNLWLDAADVSATLNTLDPFVEIVQANATYGDVAAETHATNEYAPFVVSKSEAAPEDEPTNFRLQIVANNDDPRLLGFSTTPRIRPQPGKWPHSTQNDVEPIAYDVDGDGLAEVLTPADRYTSILDGFQMGIVVFRHDGEVSATYDCGAECWSCSGIAAGDLQFDGSVEVVSICELGESGLPAYLRVWDVTSSTAYPPLYLEHEYPLGSIPTLFDLDEDGDLEIIVGGSTSDESQLVITALTLNDGAFEVLWETMLPSQNLYRVTDLSISDIDAAAPEGDPGPEIVFSVATNQLSDGGRIYCLEADGELRTGFPVDVYYGIESPPVLADLKGDGNREIIINTYDSEPEKGLRVYDHTGTLQWIGSGRGRIPVVADLDHDGLPEVITLTHVYRHDGTPTPWFYNTINPIGLSVADVNADGRQDVLIGAMQSDGLVGLRYDGDPLPGFPLHVQSGPYNWKAPMTPVIVDIDRDGDVELVATGRYLTVWDLPGKYIRKSVECAMHQYDPYRTGCYHSGVNLPPVWYRAPVDQSFARGRCGSILVQATDPETSKVTYSVTSTPAGAVLAVEGAGLRLDWCPDFSATDDDVTFTAIDHDGVRIKKTIHLAVVDQSADLDGDGDVDAADHQHFVNCLTGPRDESVNSSKVHRNLPRNARDLAVTFDRALDTASSLAPECMAADFDGDGTVSLRDFSIWQVLFGAI